MSEQCRNCGDRIVSYRNYRGETVWTHQPAGASFQDRQHHYCHITMAMPRRSTDE